MALSQTAAQKLTMLANYMDGLRPSFPDKFDMGTWSRERIVCGTRACAIGWGASMPEFMAMGFGLAEHPFDDKAHFPTFAGKRNWEAVEKFFDLTEEQGQTLFSADHKTSIETPQQWADHCRLFIRMNTVQDVAFKAFMDKAQHPVKA